MSETPQSVLEKFVSDRTSLPAQEYIREAIRAVLDDLTRWQECSARQDHELDALGAERDAAYEAGVRSVTMIRCVKHREVPQYNRGEGDGAECAACEVEPRG
jgi:hypothetical protein